jgi:PAS domain S-box-containing protein
MFAMNAMEETLRLLQIEDSASDAALIVRLFQKAGFHVQAQRVEDAGAMRAALEQREWDAIIADYNLPDFDAPAALLLLQESNSDIPFIVVSAVIGEDTAVAVMKAGAHDYLRKDNLSRLIPAVEREIREARIRKQRKEAGQALRESERRYKALFESIQEGFAVGEVIVDAAGQPVDWRYLEVNPAYESMFRVKREEVVGRTFREIFRNDLRERWVPALGEVALTGKSARLDRYSKESGRHYEAIAYSPIPGQFAAIFSDVTDRRMSEERSREAQKLETVGVLAGGVAHDFNNLLTVIMGSASSALEQCPKCEHSQAILAASQRAAFLTRQLLAYAGKGTNLVDVLDLSDVIAGSAQLLTATIPRRVDLNFDLAKGLPCIEADATRLEQIAVNLVINAGEAIPPNVEGRIAVSSSQLDVTPEIAKRHSQPWEFGPGTYVCLEVRDNGSGMDEATLAKIFDPFFTTKFTGRGLGLAAVQGIVRSSKGFIDVRSSPEEGSSFRVFLPASEKKRRTELPKQVLRSPQQQSVSVLIVDDEEMVRTLARMMLRRHGYGTLEAENGKHALEVIGEAPAPPTIVLLDLAMPVMGGDQLIPILARDYPEMKIIVSSGYPEEEARRSFPRELAAGFLQKPYTGTALTEKVRELIGSPPKDASLNSR